MDILILVVAMGALYAFLIVPQQRRVKAQQALMNSLEEGDVVVTNAGIYGAIAEVEDNIIWLEVAPEIELKVSKTAIVERVDDEDVDDDEDEDEMVDAEDGDA
ncbi:MAG: preprotein translocase subunit YajC [Acidimicrobiales bacterium]|jgi:preprotein translocase subunit YajC|nr:preprotein translocase subunit YajC [Acidimicrobiales bacterium]